jgi:DNA-binding transcriptional LysR family regulator
VPDAFGRLVVLPVIEKYLAAWPDVQVEVNVSDRLADIVDEGFDLALRIGAADLDAGLVSRVVATYRPMICASPAYLAEHGEPLTAQALASHDCLLFSSRAQRQSWRLRDDAGEWVASEGRSRLRMDSGAAIRDAAVAGLGLGLLPEFLVEQDLATGRLRQVLPDIDLGEVKIVAIYPTRRHLEPRVRRFIDLLVEELASKARFSARPEPTR